MKEKNINKNLIAKKCRMVALLLFMALLFTPLTACSKKSEIEINILHAGGGENSNVYLNAQETFEGYYSKGCRYFEYDLKLSSDGRIIGSHAGEHLPNVNFQTITYAEFKELKLDNQMTPVNEEWLMETIISHPDVKIIVDAKMPTQVEDDKVLQRIEYLESVYNYDVSANIIPEVFSLEMWEILKETTSFNSYIFSHYKVYYSVDYVMENFSDSRIIAIAMSVNCDSYYRKNLVKFKQEGWKIFMWDIHSSEDINRAQKLGANGVYVDFINFDD